mgnify:CR=1 FL=1
MDFRFEEKDEISVNFELFTLLSTNFEEIR